MALFPLLYGTEKWVLKKFQIRRLEAAKIQFLRSVGGVTLREHIWSEPIRYDLGRVETLGEED